MGLPNESWISKHRLSIRDYYRMGEAGVFAPDARVELISGEVIDMAPIGPAHAWVVTELSNRLLAAVGQRAVVRVQNPLRLGDDSEPEPDVVVARKTEHGYRTSHPGAEDCLLVVEVSDTTLRYDLEVKVPLYAAHGIAEVWVMDLSGEQVHRFHGAQDGRYANVTRMGAVSDVPLPGLAGVSIDLSGLV